MSEASLSDSLAVSQERTYIGTDMTHKLGGMSDEVIPPYDRPTHGPARWLSGDPDTWGPYENGFCDGYWKAISITIEAIKDNRNLRTDTTC